MFSNLLAGPISFMKKAGTVLEESKQLGRFISPAARQPGFIACLVGPAPALSANEGSSR